MRSLDNLKDFESWKGPVFTNVKIKAGEKFDHSYSLLI